MGFSVWYGIFAFAHISPGARLWRGVEVVSGLQGDETVVLARAESLKEGQPVEVLPPEQK